MAGLTRKTLFVFGSDASQVSSFGQFGSKVAGLPQTSQDPTVIQSSGGGVPTTAWNQGWQTAVVNSDKAAYIQDMNGWCRVHSYMVGYLYQMGIPEWDANTAYFTNSIVQTQSNGQWFRSLQGGVPGVGAGQTGNAPPVGASNAFWQWINPATIGDGGVTVGKIPKASATNPGIVVDSLLSEVAGNIVLASGGFKFPDGSVQTTAAVSSNAVTVQSPPAPYVVTPTRVIGATYQNTGTKPLFVLISVTQANPTVTTAYVDGTPTPSTLMAQIGIGSGNVPGISYNGTIFFIVLPGYYYRTSGGNLTAWTEWT